MTDELTGRSERINPVLETAYAVLPFSADVTLNRPGIGTFAATLVSSSISTPSSSSYTSMIPTESFWAEEPLHPIPSKHGAKYLADWIFMVSLLNFSFWSELGDTIEQGRYAITYKDGVDGKGKRGNMKDWTGYWSLPAAINRGLEDGIDVTSPNFWTEASEAELRNIFRPSDRSNEELPLQDTRIKLLREAGSILNSKYEGSFYNMLTTCSTREEDSYNTLKVDALELVEKVVGEFPMFRDEAIHPKAGKVYLWKRPQILVAELWAAFESVKDPKLGFPQITGISNLTMFADYRVPQILNFLNLIDYSPSLQEKLANQEYIESGSESEVNLRALSIVAVEELRKELSSRLEKEGRIEESKGINAVLLDFWLWNKAKEWEAEGKKMVECHRTRSIWY